MRRQASFRHFDKLLFVTPILIFLIGLLSIYSASFKTGQTLDQILAIRQLTWMGIGILGALLVVRADYFKLRDIAWPLYLFSIALLVLVLFMPARLGAHRWIPLWGGFNIQPSELAKFAVILMLANYFSANKIEYASAGKRAAPFLIVGVPFALILKEPDLGTGLSLVPVLLAMLYLWGMKKRHIALILLAGALFAPIGFHFLKDYQKSRLMVFINPSADPLGAAYTIIQSKIAIGSGGLYGKGFLSGTQNQLHFIPERHTDFIFAVIAEEGGFIASVAILVLFWIIVKKGFIISGQTPDPFGSQLACGVSALIGFQSAVNLGMTMGLLPVVGIPLPLVSYGGTSVVVTMLCIGLLLNIRMRRHLI